MVFNSVMFMYYFLPTVIGVFFLLKKWPGLQNLWLLAASFLFYGWCNTRFLLFLIGFGFVNYWFGRVIALCANNPKKTVKYVVLVPAISINLLILFAVKYLNFSINAANRFLGAGIAQIESIIVPLGISFLVFSMISYLVDIYWGRIQPLENLIEFFLYLSFFPKVSQGPITRCGEQGNISEEKPVSLEEFAGGGYRFSYGLAKKVLIADTLGVSVDMIFSSVETGIPVMVAWMGMLCYTFQIYFDFSGYTDMAIGLGSMFGYHLPENFRAPYLSKSVSEFWRRWHITLGTWFREYVYIPMGGNRKGVIRTCMNLALVWALTGIWHGAAYTYILWGIGIGSVVIFEKLIGKTKWYNNIPAIVKWFGTFMIIMLSWVLFRSNGIGNAWKYYLTMFGMGNRENNMFGVRYFVDNGTLVALVSAIAVTFLAPKKMYNNISNSQLGLILRNISALVLLALALLFMVNSTYSAFIYFQF